MYDKYSHNMKLTEKHVYSPTLVLVRGLVGAHAVANVLSSKLAF